MKSVFDEVIGILIVVFNFDGELYVLEDQCMYEEFELFFGEFNIVEGSVECVLYGVCFDVCDGCVLCVLVYMLVFRFLVKCEYDVVWMCDDCD